MLILFAILLGAFIGWTGYYFCKALDSWMDYGSIFYKVRLKKFFQICEKYEYQDLKDQANQVESIISDDMDNYNIHLQYMNKLFWELADRVHSFKLWICVDCMTIRYILYVSFFSCFGFSFYLENWLFLLSLPLINLVAISIVYKINA